MAENELLFSYGTLRYPEVQKQTFGRLLKGSPDTLRGYRLEALKIIDPHVLALSQEDEHPILVTGLESDSVEGIVFEVTPEELAHADAYEVAEYERVGVTLASGKNAWVYARR